MIGSVLIPGAKAPKLVTRDMLKDMEPGSVLVDVAIAITAAILFGLSLLLFPPEEGGAEPAAPEEGPCAGYERTEDLP